MLDCLIVGGGPAGLTAAIYLSRFHLKVAVIDAGQGRALSIPKTHNHAGFPDGVSGAVLVENMRRQAAQYGASIAQGWVSEIKHAGDMFVAKSDRREITAHCVLIATGVINTRPQISDKLHDAALAAGRLRYCPICDGYEVTDQNIAVIGTGECGLAEAEFLRSYTSQISLISPGAHHDLDATQRDKARNLNLTLIDGPAKVSHITADNVVIAAGRDKLAFSSVYPALGSDANNMLAKMLGATCSKDGDIIVDAHQRTSVKGLYAAGDVVIGLDQISNAMGEGGVAAVAMRNDLAKMQPLLR